MACEGDMAFDFEDMRAAEGARGAASRARATGTRLAQRRASHAQVARRRVVTEPERGSWTPPPTWRRGPRSEASRIKEAPGRFDCGKRLSYSNIGGTERPEPGDFRVAKIAKPWELPELIAGYA
jgi:hypothetical protein